MTGDGSRWLAAVATVLLWLALCAAVVVAQRRKRRAAEQAAAALTPSADGETPWVVAFASQTGFAEELAWQTARALHTGGVSVRVLPLSHLDAGELVAARRVLFIASTTGEGDPPDDCAAFVRQVLAAQPVLGELHYGLLALGDHEYRNYCAFGRRLDDWLKSCGAQPMFDRVEVDNGSATSLSEWQHHVARSAGTSDLPDWQAPAFERWRLARRVHLNPGSAGGPAFHVELEPMAALPDWQSGDLVQMRVPDADDETPREYSIASLPADGRVHLLVRQQRREDGSLGAASGWLTERGEIGSELALRLRAHRNFRLGDNAGRPLILIGNGTGLAGLRGHLKARASNGRGRNWLVFGERQQAHDFHYRDEIAGWQADGLLERADIVFSRDEAQRPYVQDRLRDASKEVQRWIDDGAAIYVCGSLQGMAQGVDAALEEIVGREGVQQLVESGRYRRDVY
jgi:sulfite reductase (NADPH) flavoprotein alpha-component